MTKRTANTTPPTHKDWENAKQKRDLISRHIVNALRSGDTDEAKDRAEQWMMLDDQMLAISNILDANDAA